MPVRPAQAVHAADSLRDGGVSGQRRQKRAKIGAGSHLWQRYPGQQCIGFFVIVAVPCMRIRPEGRAVLALMLFGLNGIERGADNRVARIRRENDDRALALRNVVGDRPRQKRVIGVRGRRVQKAEARAVPCRPVLERVGRQNRFHIPSFAHGQRGGQQALLLGAPGLREAVRLPCAFKPADQGRGVAPVMKALEGIRRRHDPARRRKPLKDAQSGVRRDLVPHQPPSVESSSLPIAGQLRVPEALAARPHGPSNSFSAAACAFIAGVIKLLRRAASVRANTSKVWQSKRLRKAGFSPRRASRRRRAPFMKVSANSLCPSPSTPSWTSSPARPTRLWVLPVPAAPSKKSNVMAAQTGRRAWRRSSLPHARKERRVGVRGIAQHVAQGIEQLRGARPAGRLAMSVTAALSWVGA